MSLHSPSHAGFVYLEFSWAHASCFLQYTALPSCCNCSPFLFRVHVGMCLFPIVWWSMPHFSHCWTPSSLHAHWGRWLHSCLLQTACLFTVWVGECLCPPSGGAFHMTATVTSFPHSKFPPLQVAGAATPTLSGWLIYLQFV
jgi:hypothetical protein